MVVRFLSEQEVLDLHAMQIARFGGSAGIRDAGLLDSALAQPRAEFDGQYLHPTLVSMAATYLFHIVMNHPFVDGNKRVGLHACLVFLELNGLAVNASGDDLYELVMSVAKGEIGQDAVARRLEASVSRTDETR
jgi:death-on-curing protein